MALVSILGGTGVFGSRVARNLARSTDASLRIVGRNERLGRAIASEVNGEFRTAPLNFFILPVTASGFARHSCITAASCCRFVDHT